MKKRTIPYMIVLVIVAGALISGFAFSFKEYKENTNNAPVQNDILKENILPKFREVTNVSSIQADFEKSPEPFISTHGIDARVLQFTTAPLRRVSLNTDVKNDSRVQKMDECGCNEDDGLIINHGLSPHSLKRNDPINISLWLETIDKIIIEKNAKWSARDNDVLSSVLNQETTLLGFIDETITDYKTIQHGADPPDFFDWRNVNGTDWTTSIKNQSGCGSCTAFGTIGALESVIQLYVGTPFACDLSEAHLFFCGGGDCKKGMKISDAIKYLKMFGVTDESCFPFSSQDIRCNQMPENWGNRAVKVSHAQAVSPTFECIKNALLQYGPLITALNVYEDFYAYSDGIYSHVDGDFVGRHCVTIVGYNNEEGYWVCKNSWGTTWGENGWFNIPYGECDIGEPTYYISGVTGNIPPFPPENPRPYQDEINTGCNVTLQWTCTVPEDKNLWFDIYLAQGNDITSDDLIQTHHENRFYHLQNLRKNTMYTWRIVARDEHGSQSIGPPWRFTTNENIPSTVKITVPEQGYLYWGTLKVPLPIPITIVIGTIQIEGTVNGSTGVLKVDVHINDNLKQCMTQEPYTWVWDEHSYGLRAHNIKMTVYDNGGNSAHDEIQVHVINPHIPRKVNFQIQ